MSLSKFAKLYRVDDPDSFRLKDWDPADTDGLDIKKDEAEDLLEEGVKRLSELQERLYAQDRWAVLLIFQAMDAAGKDSVIKHVMKGVNPQGCDVHSFKQPSQEELDHDFMWRSTRCLPERGRIGIFNRSYYEEVLVVRVHPGLLEKQKLPDKLVTRTSGKSASRIFVRSSVPRAQRNADPEILSARIQARTEKAIPRAH
jgi:polyphosphate kinase 2 (PPK2 family)